MKRLYVALKAERRAREELQAGVEEPIAIVGMACRFPGGANDLSSFWRLLEDGRDGVSTAPPDRWDARALTASVDAADAPGTMVTADGGFLDVPLNRFDYAFFRISPKEARALDPQQRLLLEIAWETLESANIAPPTLKGSRTGVYVGLSGDDYTLSHRHSGDLTAIDAYSITGSTPSTAAGRIAYFLGLEGPAVPVDTACSSSLTALHFACQGLRNRETDMALAGGVNLMLAPATHVCFSRLHAIAPDGRCKPFDAAADGYSRAEGCGMLALKRLGDAQRDGDRILAVVKATALNQDGASNGFTAPNGAAQKRLLRDALQRARLAPEDVQYVETHGTGTALGDPIEAEALSTVLRPEGHRASPLILGAVKSNVGHLEAAAGMAGVIKAVLSLRHGRIPGNLHFTTPNPLISWEAGSLRVPTATVDWPADAGNGRHAGVSSFGFSGTNAHVILGQAPEENGPAERAATASSLLALSAATPQALKRLTARMISHLRSLPPQTPAYDIGATALRHRVAFPHRACVAGATAAELADRLEAGTPDVPPELAAAAEAWRAGRPVDAEALFPERSYARVDLPSYAFDPLPCVLGTLDGPLIPLRGSPHDAAAYPLLDRIWRSPLLDEVLWETEVDLSRHDFLADHRVFGRPIMPAAAYLSMMVAAARPLVGDGPFALESIRFANALTLPEQGAVTLHLVLRPGPGGTRSFELASLTDGGAVLHASAMLVEGAGRADDGAPAAASGETLASEAVYGRQGALLDLGPAFRCADSFRRDGATASARLRAPKQPGWGDSFHPGLLDGALQLLPLLMAPSPEAALVPVAADRLIIAAPIPQTLWAEASLSPADPATGDVALRDQDGRPVLTLSGLRGAAVDMEALFGQGAPLPAFRLGWKRAEVGRERNTPDGRWIVALPATDTRAWRDALAARLARPVFVEPDAPVETVADGTGDVLWLRSLDVTPDGDVCAPTLALLDLVQNQPTGAPRLWVVTRSAHRIRPGDGVLPASAAIWGFGRSLMQEAPDAWGGLVDLISADDAEDLLAWIADAAPGTECAIRDGFLTPSLESVPLTGGEAGPSPSIRDDRSYLVTGGLGGLGLHLCGHLARKGAGRVILVGRRPPSEAAQARIDALRDDGLALDIHLADTRDAEALGRIVAGAGMPLAGVFHLAGDPATGLIAGLTADAARAAMGGKAEGAVILDRLTRDVPLDHFVLFSSAAAVLGAPGQSLYAAANAALEGVAASRHAARLPATCIAWGPWRGAGMAADEDTVAHLARSGLTAMAPERALAAMDALLGGDAESVAVMAIDWQRHARSVPAGALPAVLRGSALLARAAAVSETRDGTLLDHLRRAAAEALGTEDIAAVPVDRSLFELGLDSLMALRVSNAAGAYLGRSLPPTIVFEYPTLTALEAALSEDDGEEPAAPAVPAETDPVALSAGQEGLWFLHQTAPQSAAFNTCFSARIRSPLDMDKLEAAFAACVERHPPLHSLIAAPDGVPRRQDAPPNAFRITRTDAGGWSDDALHAAVREAYARPFRLDRDLPLRVTVWTVAEDDHVLLIVAHHTAIDVHSFSLLLEDVKTAYDAVLNGREPEKAAPETTYRDYIAWQRDLLAGPRSDALRRYWADALNGARAPETPPYGRPVPDGDRLEGRTLHATLNRACAARIEALAQERGATLFTTLLAAWTVLEARADGSGDVVVGIPTLGRSDARWAGTMGFFVSVAPIRVDLSDNPAWMEALTRVRAAVVGAMAHQDLPLRDIAAAQGERAARYPLFQTLFHLRNLDEQGALADLFTPDGTGEIRFGPFMLAPYYIDQQEGQYPLVVEWLRSPERLHCLFRYNTAYYDETAVESLAQAYFRLLASIADAPETLIDGLRMADGEADAGARTFDMPAAAEGIHDRIAAVAARTPDAVALTCGDVSLTYRELDRRANALAHRLVQRGVGAGTLVGAALERSLAQIVALLAVLKANGAYVPLSADLPPLRLREMVEDARPVTVLVAPDRQAVWADIMPDGLFVIDDIEDTRDEAPACAIDDKTPAYVLYTSGTTGTPKGVIVGHRAVLSYIDAYRARHPVDAADTVLIKTPLTFDPSVAERFLPLCVGARLVVSGPDDHRDPAALAELAVREGVSVLFSVPSQIRELLEEAVTRRWTTARLIMSGGEALPAETIRRFHAVLPQATLLNVYGPTEATVHVTSWACPPAPEADDAVRIGTPLDNARILVLDKGRQPVPVGAPGMLYIAGPCLAEGYLNRPEATDEAFVTAPESGERLYCTGDIGRWRRAADGTLSLQFLFRADSQVKIRGVRLELQEIEALARRYDGVRDAVARLVAAPSGERVLAVAFVPVRAGEPPTPSALHAHMCAHGSPATAPRLWRAVEAFPRSAHGKIDETELARLLQPAADGAPRPAADGETAKAVRAIWREVLNVEAVGENRNFFDLGGSSLLLARVRRKLEAQGFANVQILDLFDHPTVESLAAFLDGRVPADPTIRPAAAVGRDPADHAVAVIGMAIRAPGAADVDAFWEIIKQGRIGITRFSREELLEAGVPADLLDNPGYVPANGVLADADAFDARFFGYAPNEAAILDPQQRIFLETAWRALEDGGYGRRGLAPRVGVYAGSEISNHLLFNLADRLDPAEMNGGYELSLANDKDFLATRASYAMDLRGPAMTVQTACSTSLTAVVTACDALMAGHCEMALAGGVSLQLPQRRGYVYREGLVASPDGYCRPFDARAGGTVNGNGVGVVLLKPLARAVADGDTIHAVIKGWAINNDGAHKLGYTAPSEEAQSQVIADAWAHAGIDPARLGYLEAHATGTRLGDPIEAAALVRAWGNRTHEGESFQLGAVKANIGHLGAASGVAGLIKTVLVVRHRHVPPVVSFDRINPEIALDDAPFAVPRQARDWPARDGPALAGVSSFGIGGTNVHVVVEEAPPSPPPAEPADEAQVFPLSAGSAAALESGLAALADRLQRPDAPPPSRAAFTLQTGREASPWRAAIVASTSGQAAERLRGAKGRKAPEGGPTVFALFPGQGAQYPDMLLGLYRRFAGFRRDIDWGLETLGGLDGPAAEEWHRMLFPALHDTPREAAATFLKQTANTQPALFLVEHALARLWESLGVRFAAMMGHSIGEYAAAALAGVFSAEDALRLVAARGRLMQSLPAGGMLAVGLPAEETQALLDGALCLAGDNGPAQSVVSGPFEAIAEARRLLAERGVTTSDLETSHAFHSAMMEPIVAPFRAVVAGISRNAPTRPVISCLTGNWLTDDQAVDPDYWAAQLRNAVRFRQGVATMLAERPSLFLEVGPGKSLGTQVRSLAGAEAPAIVASARHQADKTATDGDAFMAALAALWAEGADVTWDALYGDACPGRTSLPGYPFDHQRFPVETGSPPRRAAPAAHTARLAPDSRFHVPHWQPTPMPVTVPVPSDARCLIVGDSAGLGGALTRRLRESGWTVDAVAANGADDWDGRIAGQPYRWIVFAAADLDGLARLAQALGRNAAPVGLLIVTRSSGDEAGVALDPSSAVMTGPALVIPREMPWVRCRMVDATGDPEAATGCILAEMASEAAEPLVAYRRHRRWVRTFEPLSIAPPAQTVLRRQGVYLLSGGLGGIGAAVARWLVETADARVVLFGRTPPADLTPEQRAVLEALGDAALYLAADVAKGSDVRRCVDETIARFGALHGVFHLAGMGTHEPIATKTPEGIRKVLSPKIDGARTLAEATDSLDLDVMVLFSSSSAVLGSSGLMDYAAANAFLDAFAEQRTASGRPTVSIGWDAWADTGLSKGLPRSEQALSVGDGLDALSRILGQRGLPHIVVSPGSVKDMLAEIAAFGEAEAAPSAVAHGRPDLVNPFVAPATLLEKEIAAVWEGVLGVSGVGTDDNFFDLGGDSLIGAKLVQRLKESVGVNLSPVILYEASTIGAMARAIQAQSDDAEPSADALTMEALGDAPRHRAKRRRHKTKNGQDQTA